MNGARKVGAASGNGSGNAFRGAMPPPVTGQAWTAPDLIAMASNIADPVQGAEMLRDLIEQNFRSAHGAELGPLEAEEDDLKARLKAMDDEIGSLRKALQETPRFIPASEVNHTAGSVKAVETAPARWQLRHRVESGVICGGISLLLVGSVLTAHANLVGSGIPIFIENPALPWSMAFIPAAGGVALKSFASTFHTLKGQRRFARWLYVASGVALLAWGGLFADQFHAMGGSIGGVFDAAPAWAGAKEKAMVGAQLLAEILLGGVLANRLDRIAAIYAPAFLSHNNEHESNREALEELTPQREALAQRLGAVQGRLTELRSDMQVQIQLAQIACGERRARFDRNPS